MKTNIMILIQTVPQAEKFLKELFDNDESYHPEDDARTIVDRKGRMIFTDLESIRLNLLMDEIYLLDFFDPCEYILELRKTKEKTEMKTIKKLMGEYGLSVEDMMVLASVDKLKAEELKDVEYIEERIKVNIEMLEQRNPVIKAINRLADGGVEPCDIRYLVNADFHDFMYYCEENKISMNEVRDVVNEHKKIMIKDDDLDAWGKIREIFEVTK